MLRISTASGISRSWIGATTVLSCIASAPYIRDLFCSWFIGDAIGGRRRRTTNQPHQRYYGEYIRQRAEQAGRNARILHAHAQSLTKPKNYAGPSSAPGGIFTENHGGQGNKAENCGHIRVENTRDAQGQERASQAGEQAAANDAQVAYQTYIHAGGIGCLRMLTYRPDT